MTHRFKITLTPVGAGSRVEIDGMPVQCRAVTIKAGVNEATTIVLEIPAAAVDIEGEAEDVIEVTALHDSARRFDRVDRP